jgi:hypothetical protein
VFIWNPGDGSDVVEGQAGRDTLAFNGSNVGETIDISANGSRVRFFRDVGNVTMDVNGVERIQFAAGGGADTITVGDLTGTGVKQVDIDLAAFGTSAGDGQADTVIVNGSAGNDPIVVASSGTTITVSTLTEQVTIDHADSGDRVVINGGAGNDVIALPLNMPGISVDGGTGVNQLRVSGGGTGVMGASIANFQSVALLNAGTGYDFTGNDTPGLRITASSDAPDTIRAGAGGDVLAGFSGDVFVLGAGSDAVQGTAAQFTGTTVERFDASGTDTIDIVDFHHPGAVSATLSGGVLSIAQTGGPTVAIDLPGLFAGSFQAASDGHGGTAISFAGFAVSGMIQAIAGSGPSSAAATHSPTYVPEPADHLSAHA